jgi:hypothetical protein
VINSGVTLSNEQGVALDDEELDDEELDDEELDDEELIVAGVISSSTSSSSLPEAKNGPKPVSVVALK